MKNQIDTIIFLRKLRIELSNETRWKAHIKEIDDAINVLQSRTDCDACHCRSDSDLIRITSAIINILNTIFNI